ncbi:MAG: PaaI family thioesterase [Bacteroidales bacterium]|jgi:acyl-CoA thioesterase|nr:PaaI family thioesterase [Bacteroidales bacterium]
MSVSEVKELIGKDKFARYCGIELTDVTEGAAAARMEILPEHLNGVGIVQGGVLYTLADLTLAAAANSYGVTAVTLTGNIAYFKAESSGMLYAEAKELSLHRVVATYQVNITNGENELIAVAQGTVYRKV